MLSPPGNRSRVQVPSQAGHREREERVPSAKIEDKDK